jgi:thiaminase/transcriptional activator TenA
MPVTGNDLKGTAVAGYSGYLRLQADPIWKAQHNHPFVRGIGDGTLDPDRFAFWLRQDYLFLIDYARLFGAGVLRAPDLHTMTTFARLAHEILFREMELHRSYCAEFGISIEDLESEKKAPTTQGYTDFLLRSALVGDYVELLGALLPCMWGYHEIARGLAERGMPDDERYRAWINMYCSEEFGELAEWCIEIFDAGCDRIRSDHYPRVDNAFMTSSRYELAFWEMAWTKESWPV